MEEAVSLQPAPALVRTPPKPVPVRGIADALRGLWRAACPETKGGDVARALTANFVGCADGDDEIELRETTGRLVRRSPCRAFLVLREEGTGEPTAEVAATTRCSGALRDIVLEEIVLRVPEAWYPHLPGLLRPLLVNDLPNHLFWCGPWAKGGKRFDLLAPLCEHVVVDSARFQDPMLDLEELDARAGRLARLGDLAWLRLRPWRRALAEAFQHVPFTPGEPVQALVRHGPGPAAPAVRFAQWLEQRLGARVELEDTGAGPRGLPEHVEVRGGGFHVTATDHEQHHLVVSVSTDAQCRLPFTVPASRGHDGDLLAAAFDLA